VEIAGASVALAAAISAAADQAGAGS